MTAQLEVKRTPFQLVHMAIYWRLRIKWVGWALTGRGRDPVLQALLSVAVRAVISNRKWQQTKSSIRNNFSRLLNEHISEPLEIFY